MSSVIDHRPGKQQAPRPRRDPAPSRLKYRLERMWLKPLYRRVVRIGGPAFLIAMTAGIWLSDEDRRAALNTSFTALLDKVQSREEFQVRMMTVEGASPVVDKALRAMLPVDLPASSFDIDLPALRLQIMQLDAVESIDLRVKPGGVLAAVVTERQPHDPVASCARHRDSGQIRSSRRQRHLARGASEPAADHGRRRGSGGRRGTEAVRCRRSDPAACARSGAQG